MHQLFYHNAWGRGEIANNLYTQAGHRGPEGDRMYVFCATMVQFRSTVGMMSTQFYQQTDVQHHISSLLGNSLGPPPLFNRNNSSNPQTWTVYQHVQSISADIGLKVFNKSWSEVTLETSSCSEFKFNRSHPSSGPPAHSECCCLHTAEVLSSGTTSPRKSYSRCSTSLAKKGRVKEKKHPSFQSSHTQS